jgi:hypothetical protein
MPKPMESLSILESASAELVKIADQIQVECGYLKSCVADAVISLPTENAGPHGDTSAPATTGLSATQRVSLAEEVAHTIRPYLQGPNPERLAETLAQRIVSCVASGDYADGGNGSPPHHLPQPPADWRGESSDPTRDAAPSVHTPMRTQRALSDALLTVAGQLCGMLDKLGDGLMVGERHMWRTLVDALTQSAARLHTTT